MESTYQRYISDHLSHFVGRSRKPEEQYGLLLKILRERWITHPPHNPLQSGNLSIRYGELISNNAMYNPEAICFCDIPIGDLNIHINKYSSFGLSFKKDFLIAKGCNPVHYIPREAALNNEDFKLVLEPGTVKRIEESNGDVPKINRAQYFDQMVRECHGLQVRLFAERANRSLPNEFELFSELMYFLDYHIFSYLKFYDHTKPLEHQDNYYMEREWRVMGNIHFELEDVRTVFLPREYGSRFHEDLPEYKSEIILLG